MTAAWMDVKRVEKKDLRRVVKRAVSMVAPKDAGLAVNWVDERVEIMVVQTVA